MPYSLHDRPLFPTPSPRTQRGLHGAIRAVSRQALIALGLAAAALGGGGCRTSAAAQADVSVVDRPAVDQRNAHYVSNRPPLQPSRFIKLPVGAVRPSGWLEEAMRRQLDGMTGELGEISAWLQKEDNAWLSPDGKGEWGWEEVPYWLKGYGNLGYLLGDHHVIAEARVWIEGTINSQRGDGNFGPARFFNDDGSQDFWANMVMLHCLQSYYEYTGDERVIELMTRYFRYQHSVPDDKMLTHYWQHMRGGDNLYAVYWLYNRTGDAFLLELADKIYRNTADWAMDGDLPNWHNVNIAQGFRAPAQYWQQAGDDALLRATYNSFNEARVRYGQVPGGMFGADENARAGYDDPRQAIETCGIVEQMFSNQIMLRITGDPFWADHCENVAFNTAPAAFLPDYRGLRYLVSPNGVTCDRHNHAPGIQNAGPFTLMSALSNRCCQHNHSHGWPYLAENLWLATPDNGLCAAMYVPSRVTAIVGDGATVTLTEETRYPFADRVSFTVGLEGDAAFPLYFRIPAWCDAPELTINGEALTLGAGDTVAGKYIRVERTWSDGDAIELRLPMEVELTRWENNHDSVSVNRGPLTFSLKIGQDFEPIPADEAAVWDARWRTDVDVEDWPAVEIFPTTAWNYGLVLDGDRLPVVDLHQHAWPEDNYPFTADASPISLTVRARRVPGWSLDRHGLVGVLQDSPAYTEEPVEHVELIPMGAAHLRISAFPVASDADDAHRWSPSIEAQHYHASASHCYEGDWTGAICDGLLPSDDVNEGVTRHTFWDHRGSAEWLQAGFDERRRVDEVAVFWFDDRAIGGQCRVPASWRLMFRDAAGAWREVRNASAYGTARARYNTVTFDPVETDALRLEVQLQDGFSAGCWEWRVGPETQDHHEGHDHD